MKNFNKLLALLALVALAASCVTPEGPNGIVTGNGPLLKVEATPAGSFTRATDTAFEQGDSFGLFGVKGVGFQNLTPENFADVLLSMESWIVNGKFTKGQSGFVGDQEYKWYEGSEESSFVALYPYISGSTTGEVLFEGVDFCVKSDQSTHAGYTASDLMGAYKEGVAPTDQAIKLEFNHLLSKLVIDLNNQTGEEIKEVYIDGVRGNFTYSLISSAPTGDYGTIKAGEVATPTEGFTDTFVLIIPPQSAAPKVAITTASDKQYTFEASEPISFGVAKKRQITVTLTPESISTSFDAIVNDWSADESVEFKDQPNTGGGDDPVVPEKKGYKVIVGQNEYEIEQNEDGSWGKILLPIYADLNEFQIVNQADGTLLGGELICSAMRLGLTAGVEKVVLPKVGLYAEYEFTLTTEGEGAPYATMCPVKVGEFDTYLGRGMVVEGWAVGVMNPVDVLADAKGRYIFFTPMKAIARTAAMSYPDMFALSESENNVASPYIILQFAQKIYNGWNYVECLSEEAIKTGLKLNANGTWGDWNYVRTTNVEGQVPYNRAVDAAGKVFQLALLPQVANVGFMDTNGQNGILTFVLPGGSFGDRKYEMVGASSSVSEDGLIVNFGIYADRDVAQIGYCLFQKLNIDNETCREVVMAATEQGFMDVVSVEQNGNDKNLSMTFTPSQSGGYTLLVSGYNAAGELCSTAYTNIDYTAPTAGECKDIAMTVRLDEARPDTQVCFEMKGSNITSAYYSCLPAAQFGSLSNDELRDAALVHNYGYLTGYLDYLNDGGYTESIIGLAPSTEYVVFGWFEDADKGYSFIRHNITTAPETEWTLLGKGMYYDGSWQARGNGEFERYASEVNIYQAADGRAHYRIEDPYKDFAVNHPTLSAKQWDTYLEVAAYPMVNAEGATVSHLCYDAHNTGILATYQTENDSVLVLEHPQNSSSSYQTYPMRDKQLAYYANNANRMLSEGVLQIQPWYILSASEGVGYNYTQASETIIVTLPGYSFEFTPEPEGVAAKSGVRRGLKNSPAMVPVGEGGGRGNASTLRSLNQRLTVGEVRSLEATKF